MEIARTIIAQLGNVTLSMLGATKLVSTSNGLQFAIKGSKRCNKIVIELAANDTYTVTSWKVGRTNLTQVEQCEGVYVDSLHATIKTLTGLETRF